MTRQILINTALQAKAIQAERDRRRFINRLINLDGKIDIKSQLHLAIGIKRNVIVMIGVIDADGEIAVNLLRHRYGVYFLTIDSRMLDTQRAVIRRIIPGILKEGLPVGFQIGKRIAIKVICDCT